MYEIIIIIITMSAALDFLVNSERGRIGNSECWPKAYTAQGIDSWLALYQGWRKSR